MMQEILTGAKPSEVFRQIIAADPTINNRRLAEILMEEFEELSGEAVQLVWHWKGPGKTQGIADENLDALLFPVFQEAGYL
ncbi:MULTISPECIES: hypothetical protein [unclassified Duganella]|uniref:hypothetical protein n=1 Tax=unclassified Duganella TaxID=2636909 RepID=UPI0006FEB8AE|nr:MULTISPECIES: hypothetical protein [unclassified Duganella]KQV46149.1 hypothetical protein ASD07_16945 [Duganella sp. Root336D2]KRB89214.1 hypothetical protein ASE26_29175 [Duganella sp. Root198D2]